MPLEQGHLVGAGQVAVVGDPLVKIMGHKIEDILLEVRAGAADRMDLVLADHLGEGKTEFRRAHRTRDREEHRAPFVEMGRVAMGGVLQRRSVEVAVVMLDELGDGAGGGHGNE